LVAVWPAIRASPLRPASLAVDVATSPALRVGTPRLLFAVPAYAQWSDFDVAGDGRFLAVTPFQRAGGQPFSVILNWTAEVRR
jgi:hypothetical protein